MYKLKGDYLVRTDLRQEGRASWNTRRRNRREPLPLGLENIFFKPEDEDRLVVEFLKELASFPDAAEIFSSPGDLSAELENLGRAYSEDIPVPAKIQNVQVKAFPSKDGSKVNYAFAELKGNWGYLAVSEPVTLTIDGINRKKVNFFYSPVAEGQAAFFERIRDDPLNPDTSNLEYCSTTAP